MRLSMFVNINTEMKMRDDEGGTPVAERGALWNKQVKTIRRGPRGMSLSRVPGALGTAGRLACPRI